MSALSTPNAFSLPEALVTGVAVGDAVFCLGTGRRRQALAAALAAASDNPTALHGRSLPEVARYMEATQSPHDLMVKVRDWVETHETQPTRTHHALAQLPVHRLIDLNYGRQLQQALQEAQRGAEMVVEDLALFYQDNASTRLIKPYGSITRLDETLLLTEQQLTWRHEGIGHRYARMLPTLREWLAAYPWVWVDVDPADPTWRKLHRVLTWQIAPRNRREFALTTTDLVPAWADSGVTPLPTDDPDTVSRGNNRCC